jgi:hypothetical protein
MMTGAGAMHNELSRGPAQLVESDSDRPSAFAFRNAAAYAGPVWDV